MKWILILLLFGTTDCFAQLSAKNIVEKSGDRIKSLKSIHFSVSSSSRYTGEITADLILARDKPYPVFGIAKFRSTGIALTMSGSRAISIAFDGKIFSYIDPEKNELVQIQEPTYQKIGRSGQFIYLEGITAFYTEKYAFDTLLKNGVSFERGADTVIFDQPAYAVNAAWKTYSTYFGEQEAKNTFYFDKKSFLFVGSASSKLFFKVKEVDKDYPDTDFTLTAKPGLNIVQQQNPDAATYLPVNTPAPDWTLPSAQSAPITLSKLKGKVVVLDFWGTWCVPCLRTMPEVQSLYDQFKKQAVEIIGVSVEHEDAIDIADFIKKKGYTYTIALDGKKIVKDYKVKQFPTLYIIDKKGTIIFAGQGTDLETKKESIVQLIQKALSTS